MNLVYVASWLYFSPTESRKQAKQAFKALRASFKKGVPFPFKVPYEIGLVQTKQGSDEYWMLAILALRNNSYDDSIETVEQIAAWLEKCRAGGADTIEYLSAKGTTLHECFKVQGYTIIYRIMDMICDPKAEHRYEKRRQQEFTRVGKLLESYLNQCSPELRQTYDALRKLVRDAIPEAVEEPLEWFGVKTIFKHHLQEPWKVKTRSYEVCDLWADPTRNLVVVSFPFSHRLSSPPGLIQGGSKTRGGFINVTNIDEVDHQALRKLAIDAFHLHDSRARGKGGC